VAKRGVSEGNLEKGTRVVIRDWVRPVQFAGQRGVIEIGVDSSGEIAVRLTKDKKLAWFRETELERVTR
jgi:hypothetical protein